jgi:hypothetical protein
MRIEMDLTDTPDAFPNSILFYVFFITTGKVSRPRVDFQRTRVEGSHLLQPPCKRYRC